MAEWVECGSLQGPQGPKGDDAMLPEGGTEGQFLKKTATGEEWSDVPAPDMSGYVKYSSEADKLTYDDGTEVTSIIIGDVNSQPYLQMNSNQVGIASRTLNQSAGFGIHETSHSPSLYLGANQGTTPKSVTGITDSISDSPEGLNLATDKAVADYVTAHAGDALPEGGTDGQVLTKTADGEAWEDVQEPTYTTVTIAVSDWSILTATKNVEDVTQDSVIFCSADPSCEIVASDAHVYCSAQGDGTLTFSCVSVPESEVVMNIEVRKGA